MWHPCNCSTSFFSFTYTYTIIFYDTYNCTLKMEAEDSSETLASLHQNTLSHSSAAGYFTYNINRQLERSARQRCDVIHVAPRCHFFKKQSLCHTHTHAQCLLSESGLIMQQSWENRQSSAAALVIAYPQFTVFIKLRKYERIPFDFLEISTELWAWHTERAGRNILSRNAKMFQTPLPVV